MDVKSLPIGHSEFKKRRAFNFAPPFRDHIEGVLHIIRLQHREDELGVIPRAHLVIGVVPVGHAFFCEVLLPVFEEIAVEYLRIRQSL